MRTALVTGGARRIGAAIVKDLAEHGYNVALQYTSSEKKADALVYELRTEGNRVVAFEADLIEKNGPQQLFSDVLEKFGSVELLVNNASVFHADSITEINEDLWDEHFAIHTKAPSLLSSAMAAQSNLGSGLIINMIDQRVWQLTPNFFSYTLSKSALWTATQTMAQALAPRIRVNAIGPGPTLPNERQSQEDFQKQVDGLILKRSPELEEFGRTIRFLDQSPSVTGQMIALDGGQHLGWETPDVLGIRE